MNAARLGLLVAILLGIALANDWSLPDRLIVLLLVALFLSWVWSRFSLQRLGLRRTVRSDRLRVGDWLVEELALINHSWIPRVWVEVHDFSSLAGHRAGHVMSLPGRGESSWLVETRCDHRGIFRLGPVAVRSGDPMGLFVRQRTIPAIHEVLVYPPSVDVRDVAIPTASMQGGQPISRRHAPVAQTVAGIREYVPGDALNRIAWTATARQGRMMVKEFEPEPSSDVWVLLDLGHDPLEGLPDATRHEHLRDLDGKIEYSIAVAGSLVERALQDGRKAGLIINREMPIRIEPDASSRQWLKVFETLAVVTPFGNRDLSAALEADGRRFTRMSGLMVVTSRTTGPWIVALRSLVQRGVPVAVVLIGTDDGDPVVGDLLAAHVSVSQLGVGAGLETASGSARNAFRP